MFLTKVGSKATFETILASFWLHLGLILEALGHHLVAFGHHFLRSFLRSFFEGPRETERLSHRGSRPHQGALS